MHKTFLSLLKNDAGNFGMIMALVMVPVIGVAAGAIDYSMASRARSAMQNSLDAALLAAGRIPGTLAEKQETVQAFLDTETSDLRVAEKALSLALTASGKGLEGTYSGIYRPFMLSILGINSIDVGVNSEVKTGTDARLDIAMVLDNTASLTPAGLAAVQGAAEQFRVTIANAIGDPAKLQIGVVPFAGAVNVGRNFNRSGLDTAGAAPNHARMMENRWVAQKDYATCNPVWGAPPPDPGSGDVEQTTMLELPVWMQGLGPGVRHAFEELVGVKTASAAEPQDFGFPPGYTMNASNCAHIQSPPMINNFDLFDQMVNFDWGGCVEARADGFDTTDQPPLSSNPRSLFVPYFWPDELDQVWADTPKYTNDYMTDEAVPGTPPWNPPTWAQWNSWGRALGPLKYAGRTEMPGPQGEFASGPNRGCPEPITPLTTNQAAVTAAIRSMRLVDAGGTMMSEGAAWGWRVLSPGQPFTEASNEPDTKRIMVIMGDGENQFSRNPREPRVPGGPDYKTSPTVSDYNAYGYLRESRLGREITFDDAQAEIDRRTLEICTNAKNDGIEVYTVLFQSSDSRAVDTLSACATTPDKHFFLASDSDQLNITFQDIATSIGRYRLVK